MPLKEKIYHAVAAMNTDELRLLYEQIALLQQIKQAAAAHQPRSSIDEILRLTSTDPGCWSETVVEERRERL